MLGRKKRGGKVVGCEKGTLRRMIGVEYVASRKVGYSSSVGKSLERVVRVSKFL